MRPFLMTLPLIALCFQPTFADEIGIDLPVDSPPEARVFLDMNGDGIDDNYTDTDGDGIPDKYVHGAVSAFGTELVGSSGIFGGERASKFTLSMSNAKSDLFGSRMNRSLCLSLSRGGFGAESDFGPGNGIGLGAVKGVTCIGGVCF